MYYRTFIIELDFMLNNVFLKMILKTLETHNELNTSVLHGLSESLCLLDQSSSRMLIITTTLTKRMFLNAETQVESPITDVELSLSTPAESPSETVVQSAL